MKKNKMIVWVGMALMAVGTILNVHDVFNEFGVLDISLHPQVFAQAGGVSGTTTTTTTEEFTATKYLCGKFSYVKVCSITNPCEQ